MFNRSWQKAGVASLVVSMCFASSQGWADDDDDFAPKRKRRVVVIDAEPHQIEEEEIVRMAPKFWLGIQCEVSDDGVIVQKVVNDSPAEEAGIEAGDLVRKINDVEINDVKTLIESVQNSKGKALEVSILRDEEVVSLNVTPDKMPQRFTRRSPHPDFFIEVPHARKFFGNEDFDMHFVNPGFVFDGNAGFPENASIKIERKNDEPTKLTIERDGEEWVVDEKSIGELPEDLQGWAKKMLRQSKNRIRRPVAPFQRFEGFPKPNQFRQRFDFRADDKDDNGGNHDEIHELRKEIRELRKLIEDMKKD